MISRIIKNREITANQQANTGITPPPETIG
jgi:hypothetical protein